MELKPEDLIINTFRRPQSGWSTLTDNVCQIIHKPSSLKVEVEDRSIHRAKVMAMEGLKLAVNRWSSNQHKEPYSVVGTAYELSGCGGAWTMVVFKSEDVPVGTMVYKKD